MKFVDRIHCLSFELITTDAATIYRDNGNRSRSRSLSGSRDEDFDRGRKMQDVEEEDADDRHADTDSADGACARPMGGYAKLNNCKGIYSDM